MSSPSSHLTDAQVTALRQVYSILSEHFDSHVLITLVKSEQGQEKKFLSYEGGYHQILGLLTQTQHDIVSGDAQRAVEEED